MMPPVSGPDEKELDGSYRESTIESRVKLQSRSDTSHESLTYALKAGQS